MSAAEGEAEAAAAAAASAVTVDANGGVTDATNNTNNTKKAAPREREKRDETPIEELYDLSKPIPKVDKPNKDAHEKALQELGDQMEALKQERAKIQEKIDAAMEDPNAKGSLQETRTNMQALKLKKNALIQEKKNMRSSLDQTKTTTDKLIKDKKDVKSNLKFTSIPEIQKEIERLKRLQETTTMSLTEEKKIIKEMDALAASKKYVATLQDKDTAMDDVKEQRKTIQQQIAAKDKEIDQVSKELDAVMAVLKEHSEKESVKRDAIQGLFQERDSYKGKMAALIQEKDTIHAKFREQNNAWFQNQRAVRAQKKMQYEEEKKRRDEEYAERAALAAAEEAKKIPYEEEQGLCDFLAEYLERTYLGGNNKIKTTTADDTANSKDAVPVAVTNDPFAGLKAVGKKDDDDEVAYFGKGKTKKKRVRAPKDVGGAPFTLSVDSFEMFGLLQLTPPVSMEQVAASVAELRAKKEWYKEQPRGSVQTAAEIRKKAANAAARSSGTTTTTSTTGGAANKPSKSKNTNSFSLSNDDFAPLGATTTTTTPGSFISNAAWGQKATASSSSNATPAEAAAAVAQALEE